MTTTTTETKTDNKAARLAPQIDPRISEAIHASILHHVAMGLVPWQMKGTIYEYIAPTLAKMEQEGYLQADLSGGEPKFKLGKQAKEDLAKLAKQIKLAISLGVFGAIDLDFNRPLVTIAEADADPAKYPRPERENEETDHMLDYVDDPRFNAVNGVSLELTMLGFMNDHCQDKLPPGGLPLWKLVFLQKLVDQQEMSRTDDNIFMEILVGSYLTKIDHIVNTQRKWQSLGTNEAEATQIMLDIYAKGMVQRIKDMGRRCRVDGCKIPLGIYDHIAKSEGKPEPDQCPACATLFKAPPAPPESPPTIAAATGNIVEETVTTTTTTHHQGGVIEVVEPDVVLEVVSVMPPPGLRAGRGVRRGRRAGLHRSVRYRPRRRAAHDVRGAGLP